MVFNADINFRVYMSMITKYTIVDINDTVLNNLKLCSCLLPRFKKQRTTVFINDNPISQINSSIQKLLNTREINVLLFKKKECLT